MINATPITRSKPTKFAKSKVVDPLIYMSLTMRPIDSKTPLVLRVHQSKATATSITIATDTDSMKAVFITDHGSIRVTMSRARRGPAGRTGATGSAAVSRR